MRASWWLRDSNHFKFVLANLTKMYYFSLNTLRLWWLAFYCNVRDIAPRAVDCLEELLCSQHLLKIQGFWDVTLCHGVKLCSHYFEGLHCLHLKGQAGHWIGRLRYYGPSKRHELCACWHVITSQNSWMLIICLQDKRLSWQCMMVQCEISAFWRTQATNPAFWSVVELVTARFMSRTVQQARLSRR